MIRHAVLALFVALACNATSSTRVGPVTNVKPDPHTDQWIARLDTVSGHFGDLEDDPVIVALLAADTDAIAPLIDVLETDRRLSKVLFDREHEWEKDTQVPVFRIAYWLLERLIGTGYFVTSNAEIRINRDTLGRKEVAAELRVELAKWGKQSRAERWYATLADDRAKPEEWMDAAQKIFRWVPDSHLWTPYDVANTKPLQGEALRGHDHPTVIELVAKRVGQLERHDACELVRLFGRWDHAAALVLGRRVMREAIAASGTTMAESTCIWVLAAVRSELGDKAALDEYAAWIANTTPPADDSRYSSVFNPMMHDASRPAMLQAADKLFGPGSPWLPYIPDAPVPGIMNRYELLETGIYRVPAFQRYVLTQLADQHVIGHVDISGHRGWSLRLANGMNMSTSAQDSEDGFPAQLGAIPVRACDYYAYYISQQDQAPKFALYWDQARRDRAIIDATAWLRALKP